MNLSSDSLQHQVTRRTMLGAAAAGTLLAMSPAFAQQPAPTQSAPRGKGPLVWLDMDQAELDAAYDQSAYAPNLQQIVKRYATNSEASGQLRLTPKLSKRIQRKFQVRQAVRRGNAEAQAC